MCSSLCTLIGKKTKLFLKQIRIAGNGDQSKTHANNNKPATCARGQTKPNQNQKRNTEDNTKHGRGAAHRARRRRDAWRSNKTSPRIAPRRRRPSSNPPNLAGGGLDLSRGRRAPARAARNGERGRRFRGAPGSGSACGSD
jgi:hypothetical protein